MDKVDCVVIGAGVVGLAVARELALKGREVLVLEASKGIGNGTSSRNSEVIHAGIYYAPGSLKARFCLRGKQLLYAYCEERVIGHRRCGKLIVATARDQQAQLARIHAAALANGVADLELLTRVQARGLEPDLECVAALLSPSTGIVDSHALMLALLGDLQHAGGMLVLNAALAAAVCGPDGMVLTAVDGSEIEASTVVNAAGLDAPALARNFTGLEARHVPTAYFAKGNYFILSGRSPFTHLIYPVPEGAGLGVHLTMDLGGQAKFGPDVQWVRSAADLAVDAARAGAFYAEVRKYWPALPDGALVAGYAGIRPKIQSPEQGTADFLVQGPAEHGVIGLVNLFGIESPGLTSALALAEHVAALCDAQRA